MTPYRVVLITAPDEVEAAKLAKGLLEAKLAACVNIVPGIASHYWWEGAIQKADEVLLLAKTKAGLMPELISFVRSNHPYKVPEVLALDVTDGNRTYLDWIGASTIFVKPPQPTNP